MKPIIISVIKPWFIKRRRTSDIAKLAINALFTTFRSSLMWVYLRKI